MRYEPNDFAPYTERPVSPEEYDLLPEDGVLSDCALPQSGAESAVREQSDYELLRELYGRRYSYPD